MYSLVPIILTEKKEVIYMTLHIEANTQLEVVTEFGHGGVLLTMVRSEVDDMWE